MRRYATANRGQFDICSQTVCGSWQRYGNYVPIFVSAAVMQQAATTEQSEAKRRPRGRPWPKGTSGNPSGRKASARFATLFADLADELGSLTAIERQQLAQAVRLMIKIDTEKDAAVAVKLSSESRRLLNSLRKRGRSPRGPTLQEYLASRAQDAANERSEAPA